jgi:sterol desaturase/sphingolipid hydroxylase (fatty acid hydroxylase superfamily)
MIRFRGTFAEGDFMTQVARVRETASNGGPMSRDWHYHPDLPIGVSPVFAWPPRPVAALTWLGRHWVTGSMLLLEFALAWLIWAYFHPSPAEAKTLALGWVSEIWLRNLFLLTLIAGGLHIFLYNLQGQAKRLKFDPRDLSRNGKAFTWRNQVLDNMFWSLASGVTIWTAYEVLYFWAAANGTVPGLAWADNPLWFVAWFVLVQLWAAFHFYWIHRALHWPPLYRLVHALHHRNINIGPWSGISMHPVEHVLYFSGLLIHVIVPSHPVHVIFHLCNLGLNPAASHSGFAGLVIAGRKRLALGDFFHQLHHRHFDCNYGTAEVPLDKWFGTFHDGTPEARRRIRRRATGGRSAQAME